jgi:hypothetical protein
MSDCETCGRDDGHNMGCAEAVKLPQMRTTEPEDRCTFGDCTNLRRPPGRGARPKYCTDHSDPKNRK